MHGSIFFTGVFSFAVTILKHNFQGLVFLKKQHSEKLWIFCTKTPSALTGDSEFAGPFHLFQKSPVMGRQLWPACLPAP